MAILAAAGLVAGVINTMAGGGSLLTLPALIFAGLPPQVANATNRVGILLQSGVAAWGFSRGGALEPRLALRLLPWAMSGSLAGALFSVELDQATMRRAIGVVMLVMLVVLLWKPQRWVQGRAQPDQEPPRLTWGARLTFVGMGLYGGFLQAGVGVLLLTALVWATGRDVARANALKVVLVGCFTVPPLLVFLYHDQIDWGAGLALSLGSMAGGWLGARLTLSWGPAVVRYVLVAVVLVSASRLLGLW